MENKNVLQNCVFNQQIGITGGSIYVIYQGKQIAVADIHVHKRHIKINKFGVEKEYRNQGIGKALMVCIINWCNDNKIYAATVLASSGITKNMIDLGITNGLTQEGLEKFYHSFGFTEKNGNLLHRDFKRKCLYRPKDVFWCS